MASSWANWVSLKGHIFYSPYEFSIKLSVFEKIKELLETRQLRDKLGTFSIFLRTVDFIEPSENAFAKVVPSLSFLLPLTL